MTAFFDTNVVVYAFLDDPRQEPALAALKEGGVISAQVLNEFTSVSRRMLARSWDEIDSAVAVILARCPSVVPLTENTHRAALAIARESTLSFYDALIVAAAAEAGCTTLLSEDMQHGRMIAGVTIRNPFR